MTNSELKTAIANRMQFIAYDYEPDADITPAVTFELKSANGDLIQCLEWIEKYNPACDYVDFDIELSNDSNLECNQRTDIKNALIDLKQDNECEINFVNNCIAIIQEILKEFINQAGVKKFVLEIMIEDYEFWHDED